MSENYTPIDMLSKLVSFPTISQNSNLDLIEFVKDYLVGLGLEPKLVYDDSGKKASLHALVGPFVENGVVLSAHTDVVPVEGQHWQSDPFVLTERDGKLFGRGAVDMKGFVACVLANVPRMLTANLKYPILIALSYDEEVGCLGAPAMIDRMLEDFPKPKAVVVGEPSTMKVVTAQKGIVVLKTDVTGHSVHSSQIDRGVSAITVSAKLINWLDNQNQTNARNDGDKLFSPPYTTLHCGIFEGGTAHNIVAGSASFVTDIRTVTGDNPTAWKNRYQNYIDAEILPGMKLISPSSDVKVTQLASVPGLEPEVEREAELLCRQLTGDNSQNGVVFATEAGQFQERGISAVICGPGSIDQAHQPNEFIKLDQIKKCEVFLDGLISKLSH